MTEEREYMLGEDVTSAARPRSKSGTAVLSVRLTAEELSAIERVALETGKTLSQVVREALRSGIHVIREPHPAVTVSIRDTSDTSFGAPRQVATAASGKSITDLRPLDK
jgi:hypothetical protein